MCQAFDRTIGGFTALHQVDNGHGLSLLLLYFFLVKTCGHLKAHLS
jgi:hypothetical protein